MSSPDYLSSYRFDTHDERTARTVPPLAGTREVSRGLRGTTFFTRLDQNAPSASSQNLHIERGPVTSASIGRSALATRADPAPPTGRPQVEASAKALQGPAKEIKPTDAGADRIFQVRLPRDKRIGNPRLREKMTKWRRSIEKEMTARSSVVSTHPRQRLYAAALAAVPRAESSVERKLLGIERWRRMVPVYVHEDSLRPVPSVLPSNTRGDTSAPEQASQAIPVQPPPPKSTASIAHPHSKASRSSQTDDSSLFATPRLTTKLQALPDETDSPPRASGSGTVIQLASSSGSSRPETSSQDSDSAIVVHLQQQERRDTKGSTSARLPRLSVQSPSTDSDTGDHRAPRDRSMASAGTVQQQQQGLVRPATTADPSLLTLPATAGTPESLQAVSTPSTADSEAYKQARAELERILSSQPRQHEAKISPVNPDVDPQTAGPRHFEEKMRKSSKSDVKGQRRHKLEGTGSRTSSEQALSSSTISPPPGKSQSEPQSLSHTSHSSDASPEADATKRAERLPGSGQYRTTPMPSPSVRADLADSGEETPKEATAERPSLPSDAEWTGASSNDDQQIMTRKKSRRSRDNAKTRRAKRNDTDSGKPLAESDKVRPPRQVHFASSPMWIAEDDSPLFHPHATPKVAGLSAVATPKVPKLPTPYSSPTNSDILESQSGDGTDSQAETSTGHSTSDESTGSSQGRTESNSAALSAKR